MIIIRVVSMRTGRKLIFVIFALFNALVSYSQKTDVYEVEINSNSYHTELPYDKPLTIRIKGSGYIENAYLIETNGKEWYKALLKIDSPPRVEVKEKEIDGKKYSEIYLSKHQTLDPNKEYTILLNKPNPEGLAVFDNYHADSSGRTWKKKRSEFIKNQEDAYGTLEYTVPEEKEIKNLYDSLLKGHYKKLDSLEGLRNDLKVSIQDIKIDSLLSLIVCLENNHSKVCPDCNSSKVLFELSNNAHKLETIAFGAESTDGKKKAKTCKDSLSIVRNHFVILRNIMPRLIGLDAKCNYDSAEIYNFKKYVITLESVLNNLIETCNQTAKIEKAIFKRYFYAPYSLDINTLIYNFKTRAATRVIPDFGLLVYGYSRKGFQKEFTGFSPALGFRINLRPVDKSIPWKVYPDKTIWHYLTVTTGWTLASVAEEGERADLFKTSSFYTGLGVKLYSHALVLNVGALFFNAIDPNPTISDKDIAATGYLGISVDLELQSIFNGLGDLF
jgi:hypothetical protein